MPSTKKNVLLNTITSLFYHLVVIAYNFITPKLIIAHYGSEKNGWLSSIITYLSLISVCEFGIGAVIKANLYKPLYDKNDSQISKIMKSADKFFYRIGLIFLIYTIILIGVFPILPSNKFGFQETTIMIVVVSLGTFSQYFFGISSQLLLEADQKGYISYLTNILATTAVIVSSVFLIKYDFSLLQVRIAYAIIFSVRPLTLYIFTRKKYRIDKKIKLDSEPIKQKWHGFSLHIAQLVQNNTDVIVLSALSVMTDVSIYKVYHMVTNGLCTIINILGYSVTPVFGRLFAAGDRDNLKKFFARFEWVMHCVISCIFAVCGCGIVPFVSIYSRGVTDADYVNWIFGILLIIATAIFCLTQLYITLINATGRFKETEKYIIIEPIINIFISVVLVHRLGLIGVAIGTIVSQLYKLVYLVIYLSKHIIKKSILSYVRLLVLDAIIVVAIMASNSLVTIHSESYISWILSMLIIGSIGLVSVVLGSIVFFRKDVKWLVFEANIMLRKNKA